jgi:hypothetical protein
MITNKNVSNLLMITVFCDVMVSTHRPDDEGDMLVSASIYRTIWRNIPEDGRLHIRLCENLKSHLYQPSYRKRIARELSKEFVPLTSKKIQ